MTKTIAVFLRHGSKWDPARGVREQDHWDEHASFMDALFDAGKVMLAGPFADDSGSMVILAADSVEAARAIFQEDPWAHQDILLTADAKEWTIFLDSRKGPQG
ncbi:MAG: YciI family protein [Anaerolineae bacterium]